MDVISIWKNRKPEWLAFFAAMVAGVLTHAFGLVQMLHNYDDIAQQPKGYGTGITSGRWFLSLLGDAAEKLGGNYNLPWINGLLFLLLVALTASAVVSFFNIRKRNFAILFGMLFAVFPTVFSTLTFRYTAVYYGIGILLSVLAAWCVHEKKYSLLVSGLCTACSLGIYQAYVPITVTLFVMKLIQDALRGDHSFRKLVCKGFYYCAALLLGLFFYFVLLKIFLVIYGTELSNYQGVNQMGQLSLQDMSGLIKEAIYSVIMLPLQDYCGVTAMAVIKVIYLLIGCVSLCIAGYILFAKIRRWEILLFVAVMFGVFPVAVNFIVIMCPDSWIYTLMVYSFVLIPFIPMILFECMEGQCIGIKSWLSKGIGVVMVVLISCYVYQTNINYTALYYSNRQVENYLNSLVTQVRMTDGFHPQLEWAFLGEVEDPLLHCYWEYEMTYGGIEFTEWMLRRYSMGEWIRNYYGYTFPVAEEESLKLLPEMEEVKQMPCWPDYGSVQVVDKYVVIKFEELAE